MDTLDRLTVLLAKGFWWFHHQNMPRASRACFRASVIVFTVLEEQSWS